MKSQNVATLLTNLRLLDFDFNAFPLDHDVFTSLSGRAKAFEHITHHLYSVWDREECEVVSCA